VPVLGLWARRPDAARAAAALAGVAAFSPAPPDLLLEAEVVLVAVKDDAIGAVASQLCATGMVGKSHVLLHCAGATAAATAFAPVLDKVGGVGTLHPLRAIASAADIVRTRGALKGTVFGVEGDARGAAAAATLLVAALGGTPLAVEGATMGAVPRRRSDRRRTSRSRCSTRPSRCWPPAASIASPRWPRWRRSRRARSPTPRRADWPTA
jgi:hypothetical protein